jgi:hypothetical protein
MGDANGCPNIFDTSLNQRARRPMRPSKVQVQRLASLDALDALSVYTIWEIVIDVATGKCEPRRTSRELL